MFPPAAARELCVESLMLRPRVTADVFGFVVYAAHASRFGPCALRVKPKIERKLNLAQTNFTGSQISMSRRTIGSPRTLDAPRSAIPCASRFVVT